MKKVGISIFALATIIFSSCTISDQSNQGEEIDPSMIDPENPPVITFENEVFDFGEIAVGSTVSYAFKFENTGEGPLIIHDVKPSCGCTALKNWPKGALKPGAKGEIPIEFTPNIGGKTTKTVSIVTNANPSVMKLTIKGEVVGG